MKKKVLSLLLAGAMALSLCACGSSEAPASTPADTASTEAATAPAGDGKLTGTLNMGVIGPLTGAAAIYGTCVANSAQIAVDEINAISSDFQIALNSQDDEHDAEKSVNAYHNLMDWNVQMIVGCVTTTPCIAVSAEANSDRVFMLTPSASGTAVTEGKDNVFQLCFSDPNQGSASAQYISDKQMGTKIAVIYNNGDAYSTGIYQTFAAKAAELGLEIVSTTTFPDDNATDFSVQLKEAKDAGADLIFLPIYYTPASLILQQASTMGYAPTFFGVDGMDGILTLEGFDTSLAEGVILLTPFVADAKDDATVNFVSKYQAQYGEIPNQFGADAYDCVNVIYAALQKYAAANGGFDVTGVSYSELCEILISVFTGGDFSVDGLTGDAMTWNAAGEVNKAPKGMIIKDGAYVSLD
ncbi:MAG: ABC transporter substrate-binding protein [Lachnospiraceae bacterium]|nr:ABC transporter substrate-binding protein [Lachnospiraceae bacterium]